MISFTMVAPSNGILGVYTLIEAYTILFGGNV
jgi:hypothetical protein